MGVNKSDQWAADLSVPTVPNYRGRRANYRTGTATVGKRQTGVVEGVATPKRVQPGRKTARKVGGSTPTTVRINPATMLPENPQMVGKADSKRREKVRHARRVVIADPRFGVSPMSEQNKEWRRHWKTNAGGMAVGYAAGAAAGAGVGHLRRRSLLLPALIGGVGGQLTGATVARHKIIRRMEDSGHLQKRDRRYNPEANRQRRLGYAAAGTGIAGGAALAAGGRSIRNASRNIDASAPNFKVKASQPGTKKEAKQILELLAERRKHGINFVSGRSAGKLGVGAGLLATSAGLAHHGRSRANREWR